MRPVGPIRGKIRPPGSKSITNRALVCAALAAGTSRLTGALFSEDTEVMIAALRELGIAVEAAPEAESISVHGCGGRIPVSTAKLYTANSGTTMRFLTAIVSLGAGEYWLDGSPRMRERPIADLVEALRQLGVEAWSVYENGCPPVRIYSTRGFRGRAQVAGNISSQFLSGLLMAMPCAPGPVELMVSGELVSVPYVEMTLGVMRAFGAQVEHEQLRRFFSPGNLGYQAREYAVEPDASAASYFLAAAAVSGGEISVLGLGAESLQGDVRFCDCLQAMGCHVEYATDRITLRGGPLRGIEVDMNAISDTVPTLAVVALFAAGPTTIRGVAHIRHKETDRIKAVATELRKLGAQVEEFADGMRIVPGPLQGAVIDTYDDHRMAMSFAVAGLRQPGVVIRNPACTAKTYPQFFDDLRKLAGPCFTEAG